MLSRYFGACVLIPTGLFLAFRAKMKGFSPWPGRVSSAPFLLSFFSSVNVVRQARALLFMRARARASWSKVTRASYIKQILRRPAFTCVPRRRCSLTTFATQQLSTPLAAIRIASRVAISRHTRPSNSNWRAN